MKNYTFLFLIFSLSLMACNTAMKEQQEIISGMEKTLDQNTNDQFLRPLVANYINYSVDFPKDEMTPIYLYRCAVLYYRVGNYKEAIINLETILREHSSTPILEDTYLTLAMICNIGGQQNKRAEELYNQYKEKYPEGKGMKEVDYFFKPLEEKLTDHITQIQNDIANLPRGQKITDAKYTELAWAYINFIKAKPNAPITAAYCMQAARLAIRLEHYIVAIELLDKIYKNHPDYNQYPEALLLLAVEYDNSALANYLQKQKVVFSGVNPRISKEKLLEKDLQQEAAKLYKEILKKYPNHAVATSAQAGLKNLGKKTAKVVEEFLQKQKEIQKAIGGQTESL